MPAGLTAALRGRRAFLVVAFIVGAALLLPVFRVDALGSADPGFFATWQNDSESLVLAKVQALVVGDRSGASPFGLVQTLPDMSSPRSTFDALLRGGVPTSDDYSVYISQLGLQGWLFTGFYFLGAHSIGTLWTIETALFAVVLLAFALLLASVTRRSLAVLLLVTTIGSPWVVAAARNLYWVPWTWLLPACAAVWFVRASGRGRAAPLAAVFAAFLLRCTTGYEFLTSIVLLAAGVPLLAALLGGRGTVRRALKDGAWIFGAAVVAFLVVLVVQMLFAGQGNLGTGAAYVVQDAAIRTYGGDPSNPEVAASMAVSPLQVLGQYFFAWPTDVLTLGSGAPATIVFGPMTVWLLTAAVVCVVLLRASRNDGLWRRDAFLALLALAIPVSWYLLAKGHSYIHRTIDFVLWYQLTLALLVWVLLAFLLPTAKTLFARGLSTVKESAR